MTVERHAALGEIRVEGRKLSGVVMLSIGFEV